MSKQEMETKIVKQAVLGTGLTESIYQDSNGKYFAVSNNVFSNSQLGGHTFNSIESMEKAYKKQGITVTIQDPPAGGIIAGNG